MFYNKIRIEQEREHTRTADKIRIMRDFYSRYGIIFCLIYLLIHHPHDYGIADLLTCESREMENIDIHLYRLFVFNRY